MNDPECLPFPHPRHCPTSAEVLFHKNIICDLDREIDAITERVIALQARIQILQKRRENRLSYISPLRRLPLEIIYNIIHICLDVDVKITVMTQICGTLRDIVHGMSDIWSRIVLDDYSTPYKYSEVRSFIALIMC
jgi:hypothetical protein